MTVSGERGTDFNGVDLNFTRPIGLGLQFAPLFATANIAHVACDVIVSLGEVVVVHHTQIVHHCCAGLAAIGASYRVRGVHG